MADEIKLNLNVTISGTNLEDTVRPGQLLYTLSSDAGGNPGVVAVGTSEENISFGDITPGLVVMQNLDPTNFVEFGQDDASTMKEVGKISPGKLAVFELAASETIRMKADTAACNVSIKGYPIS